MMVRMPLREDSPVPYNLIHFEFQTGTDYSGQARVVLGLFGRDAGERLMDKKLSEGGKRESRNRRGLIS